MSDIAVRVENLGKRYTIGGPQAQYQTMRETATQMALAPLRRLRQLGRPGPAEETFWALKDVSFEVKQGDVVGIIGRNGAGKTTLLKILSRITNPTEGYAETRGRVGSLLEVGTGFHPELTGRENIYLNGAILGMKRTEIDRKFDEIVAFSEIEKFLDTPVKRYSSGMYVRLAFAVAAHLEPEILLVDEVLAVGDAAFQKKCLGKMGDVAQEGRTVLFVSHNMVAIKSLCPCSILLCSGEIAEYGESRKVAMGYLQSTTLQAAEKTWADPQRAPGNDKVRLKTARVVAGSPTGHISVETPIDIEFEFWNYQEDGGELNFSLVLYTHEEVCVLNTVSSRVPCSAGVVRGVCHIPGSFLNDAIYRVRILIVQDSRVIFEDTDILSFEVVEGERKGGWHGKWIGVVRPKLNWDVEYQPWTSSDCHLAS